MVIDKRIHVTGPRQFKEGLTGWYPGKPEPATQVPIIHELAFGTPNSIAALLPDAAGTPHELPGSGANPVDRHGMDQVINGIESQKSEDQSIIAQDTGKQCG